MQKYRSCIIVIKYSYQLYLTLVTLFYRGVWSCHRRVTSNNKFTNKKSIKSEHFKSRTQNWDSKF